MKRKILIFGATGNTGAYLTEYCREIQVDRILYPQTESDLSGYWGRKFIIKPNFTRNFVMDIENAKEELSYEPKFLYLDYLREFKKEMKINRFKELREGR